ncbi:hypothetical protein VTO42DRAFT_4676 [Malbranchea cinnamomea]
MWFTLYLLWIFSSFAVGNVEKTIFTAPDPEKLQPSTLLDIASLKLYTLSPSRLSLRLPINREFPSEAAPKGTQTWFYLDSLHPGQRYEVRICWLATQPTAFYLNTYTLSEILDSPSLRSSLTASPAAKDEPSTLQEESYERQSSLGSAGGQPSSSSLLLLVEAAADYFTLNETLMASVPPVQTDIILDPYLLNVFPESLIPTAGYLVVVAVAGWYVSGLMWSTIKEFTESSRAPVPVGKKTD